MKNNLAKVISTLLIATVLLGFASILPIHAALGPTVFVDPSLYSFYTSTTGVGSTFPLRVSLSNTTNVAGAQIKLTWDPTLLKCNAITEIMFHTITPPSDYGNIWSLQLSYNNVGGYAEYSQTWLSIGQAVANGYCPANITMADYPPEGKIYLFELTMQVLKAPTLSEGSFTCPLDLATVKISNPAAVSIPVTIEDGTYLITYSPPSTFPYFSVDSYTATNVGEIFNVSVYVNRLQAGWEAVGFEFKLGYNATILDILAIYYQPWLPAFVNPPDLGTLNLTAYGAGYVQIGEVVLPAPNGTWIPPFPSAPDPNPIALAKITFNATQQGIFPNVLSCPLDLYDTKIGDWLGGSVNQTAPVDGFYSIKAKVLGRRIDVYVCNYPSPYGGQGQNEPSDMFWPQKEVCLCADVSYNEWPEQQKDVAFEIFDPHGTRWGVIYARTNETGTARVCFRLPWPCDDPEYYIGVWEVVATVDIACIIVNDTMEFHYDYLVRIWKVTADKDAYKHNESMCLTIEFGSHSQQIRNVTVAVTALDEVGVPFGFEYFLTQIGGTVFCQYKNYTTEICLYIPKWARAGEAEIDTAILDTWPYLGGTVHSGYYLEDPHPPTYTGDQWLGYCPIWVNIEAAWA